MCKKILKYDPEQISFKDLQNSMKEFDILHLISHPSICNAIGINTAEPISNTEEDLTTIALFLEYLEHKLTDLITEKALNNTLKTKVAIEIVHGMAYLHDKGIIHRNFDIDSVMLDSDFNSKIINFGQAKIIECLSDQTTFAESMTKNIGSIFFMSPEMMNDDDVYDSKTDVYSFGMVLFYIFSGRLPKYSLKEKSNRKLVLVPSDSTLMSNFCLDLISKCLENDPNERPSFIQILKEIRKNSYSLTNDIDISVIQKRDRELTVIDHL